MKKRGMVGPKFGGKELKLQQKMPATWMGKLKKEKKKKEFVDKVGSTEPRKMWGGEVGPTLSICSKLHLYPFY